MSRISLVKEYDNKDVIQQIKNLTDLNTEVREVSEQASADSKEALASINDAFSVANQALALAKPAKESADRAIIDSGNAQKTADTAMKNIKEINIITDEVSGTIITTPGVGESKEIPIPIASAGQTGLMNAQTFAGIGNLETRVSTLEGRATTKYVVLPNDTPSQSEITVAFTNAAGRAPVTGDYATDIARALTYGYNGTQWVKVSVDTSLPQFAVGEFGVIKGAPTSKDGAVIAEADGTGSVQGWDKVKTDISNNASTIVAMDSAKADKLKTQSVVIASTSWSDKSVTAGVAGVTATNIVWVSPSATSYESYTAANIRATEQGEGTLTFVCEEVPTSEITVSVVIG